MLIKLGSGKNAEASCLRYFAASLPELQTSSAQFAKTPTLPLARLMGSAKKVSGTFCAKHPKGAFLAKGNGHFFPIHASELWEPQRC
ncbi:MAG TPA: hypothetical protein DDZ51_25925 [Planctomycetaceae bacterium]|nr:hypothetical protein [Planctomycetaceae bacterium]